MDQNRDQDRPNQNANREQAEGSRETTAANERQQSGQSAAGITNRPLDEEQEEQAQLPPRGQSKSEEQDNGYTPPAGQRGDDDLRLNLDDDTRRRDTDQPRDTGHTSGGGSLGHDQPADVIRDTGNRNATGSGDDPVMPEDDATLKTTI